jgi:hypothetical protein
MSDKAWYQQLAFPPTIRSENPARNAMNPEDVSQAMSEWMRPLSNSEKMRALAIMYSHLTVATRELFFPQTTMGKERIVLELLHGINEIHHTLANFLLRWGNGEEDWTPEVLSRQLVEIAVQYRILNLLQSSAEFARTRKP